MLPKTYLTEVVLLTKSYNLQDFKDWLYWHLDVIGFQHAHIFDNESSVDIKSVCREYGRRVTYEFVNGWPNQYALYNRYINNESPAWWVLPIDDDEFVYVSGAYQHNINQILVKHICKKHPSWNKVCIGWRNMYPLQFTDNRLNPHMILNARGWHDDASEIWQAGNRPVKTMCKMTVTYDWADKNGQHRTHNPFVNGIDEPGYTLNGETITGSWQSKPTPSNVDLMLFHYQFKCDSEWRIKCAKRVSPGSKNFGKNFPEKYTELYKTYSPHSDNRMYQLWTECINYGHIVK